MANSKISELPLLQKLGNLAVAPSATRNWDFAYTWTGGSTWTGLYWNFTDTSSAAGTLLFDLAVGGTSMLNASKTNGSLLMPAGANSGVSNMGIYWGTSRASPTGAIGAFNTSLYFFTSTQQSAVLTNAKLSLFSSSVYGWSASGSADGGLGVAMGSSVANSITSSPTGVAGSAISNTVMRKEVTAIADATATAVFTVTVPNAAHSASIQVTLNGRLGAGGAIGADEATGTASYIVSLARTAGVNAVASISSVFGSATSSVAGAATITVAGTLSAISGAVGATNTFDIRVTITKGSGSSANHKCTASATVLNSNATGITIA